ncbi:MULTISPECIES: 6-phosphogluconolactonase [Psychrilyobacter]|nr:MULTISPECIES: 6-phosphogluconolactonase [Psychrilyobacter]MCS5420218.1 6-phosphogluconolactonase [Psychrilyobacter sp. S5]NDI77243.1 6-phosphogluconolactonase [Psychrilyobacter piezotolerans]
MPIKIFESERSMAIGAIDIIKSELQKKEKLSIAFSGGKTPVRFFQLLAAEDINWKNINIFLVDERWVPLDHLDSNYCLINMFLLKHITIPNENIHHIDYSPSIERSRKEYEDELLKYFKGNIIFDLIFLGVGNDGHTASIFEENEAGLLEDVIVTSSRSHPYRRISLGMNVINMAERKIFLLGPEKISIIESTISKNLPVSKVVDPEFLSYIK